MSLWMMYLVHTDLILTWKFRHRSRDDVPPFLFRPTESINIEDWKKSNNGPGEPEPTGPVNTWNDKKGNE